MNTQRPTRQPPDDSFGHFAKHELMAMCEIILLLLTHAVVVCVALLLGRGVQYLHHLLEDPHATKTVFDSYFEVGINAAERILALGLIAFGTITALRTFYRRRRS